MKTAGIIFVIAGLLVLFFPDFIRVILGGVLLFVGANILVVNFLFKKGDEATSQRESFQFGPYEIFRNKK